MQYACIFLCAAAAWLIACLFAGLPSKDTAVTSAAAGTVCAALAFLLPLTGAASDWSLLVFPLVAAAVPLRQERSLENRGLSLLLAAGTYALLSLLGRMAQAFLSAGGALALSCIWAAAFAAAAYALQEQFPPEDWQKYFDGKGQERITVRREYIWLVLGLMAGLEIALLYAAPVPGTVWQAFVSTAASLALYWGALCGVCLMVAYRRERLTTLIDQNYRTEMQSFMSVIRSQRHDYNFHVQVLSGLINDGDIEECRRYLNNLVRDSADMNTILPIKDPAIAALVFSFRTMALEQGIELHVDIRNDLSCVVTSVYETNKVIGNLLQNAIDEVRTHEDKSFGIHLQILKRGENCVIRVSNKVRPEDASQGARFRDICRPGFSTKPGHEGIGLNTIQNMLRRYRGVVYFRTEDDIVHFVAKIPLKLQGEAQ